MRRLNKLLSSNPLTGKFGPFLPATLTLAMVALTVTPLVSPAQITNPNDLDYYYQYDEFGNGHLYNLGQYFGTDDLFIQGLPGMDILSGMTTLRYPPVQGVSRVAGDVVVTDPDGSISDVIRFAAGTYAVLFYSDLPEAGEVAGPADVGFPATLQANHITLVETVLADGQFGCLYVPQPGQPGYLGTTLSGGYNIISDVPEPASFVLLGVAGGLALLRKRR